MYKAYGYKTVETLKEEYEQNRAWNIQREMMIKLPCHGNCQLRCEECLSKIVDCDLCHGASPFTTGILDWWKGKKLCHVCGQELAKEWYFCDVCESPKKSDSFCGGVFHGKQKALTCRCAISCCGERYCSTCTGRMTLGFCEFCQESFCVDHAHFHRDAKCADSKCKVVCCVKQGAYCSKICRERSLKECSVCGKKEMPLDLKYNGTCYSCFAKYGKNFYYQACSKCGKYKKTRYHRQRNKVSQPLVWLCGDCRKEELKKCAICGCCIILSQKEWLENGAPCKKAYFISRAADGTKSGHVCSRPKCVVRALKEGDHLTEPGAGARKINT